MRKTIPAIVRFDAKVDKSGGPDACWPWTAAKTPSGYGVFSESAQRRAVRAHRWAWAYHNSEIPGGMTIDHLCSTRDCQNTRHMEVVTPSENSKRANGGKPYCPKGHSYEVVGYTYRNAGTRWCNACRDTYNESRRSNHRDFREDNPLGKTLTTHCVRGHEYTEDNTYYFPSTGARACTSCRRVLRQQYKARRNAAEREARAVIRDGKNG